MKPLLSSAPLAAALLIATSPAWSAEEAPRSGSPEPQVKRTVIEDDGARIEELKIRGQTRRIVVTPKNGKAPTYEIVPADPGRDPSITASRTGLAGQRVWSIGSF